MSQYARNIYCYFKAPKICSYPDEQDLVSEPVASLRQILDGKLLCAVTGRVVLVHTILQITRDCEKNPLICKMTYELSALSSGPEDVPLVICLRGKIVPMWSMSLNNSCWSHSTNYKLNCVITGSERRQMLNLVILLLLFFIITLNSILFLYVSHLILISIKVWLLFIY